MSNFNKEQLQELYTSCLPFLGELQKIAVKEDVSFQLDVTSSGRIEITSRVWTENNKGEKTLDKMYISQTKGSITDGCETIKYES